MNLDILLYGHLDYSANVLTKFSIVEERTIDSEKTFSYIDSQTLEMDADSFALNLLFKQLEWFAKNPEIEIPNSGNIFYENLDDALSYMVFALYSFFRLCDIVIPFNKKFEGRTHPAPIIRTYLILGNITTILLSRKVSNIDQFVTKLYKMIKEAEEAFTKVTYTENQSEFFLSSHGGVSAYMNKITNNWNNVRPLLIPYALGYLPPFAEIIE